jgi:TolB-like protein
MWTAAGLFGVLAAGTVFVWLDSGSSRASKLQPVDGARPGISIFVAPFEDNSRDGSNAHVARALTREVVGGLTRFDQVAVFSAEMRSRQPERLDLLALVNELRIDYMLSAGISISADVMRVSISLIDVGTGRHIWSETLVNVPAVNDVAHMRDLISGKVVETLAQPPGATALDSSNKTPVTRPRIQGTNRLVAAPGPGAQ